MHRWWPACAGGRTEAAAGRHGNETVRSIQSVPTPPAPDCSRGAVKYVQKASPRLFRELSEVIARGPLGRDLPCVQAKEQPSSLRIRASVPPAAFLSSRGRCAGPQLRSLYLHLTASWQPGVDISQKRRTDQSV
ncbi:hypothetical protein NDU88_004322 [Pleurodeles waltl]|uniref:Uncharacterized protein n=1 Tax=Pleurodeles waltl TaxID=8319 RepID=A0AAV7TRJ2_PLEWA|nr:hypothetical protein NDU88_004322 [Pleurodeles waltl]